MSALRNTPYRMLLLLPGILAVLLYWRAVEFGYVWDDVSILVDTPQFRDWHMLWHSIFHPFLNNQAYFRPLALFTLGVEQLLGGGKPFFSHLDQLLLHACNSILVAILGVLVCERHVAVAQRGLTVGLMAGLLYAVHPALVETAAWISVRFDGLMTFFCLMALVADRLCRSTQGRAISVSALFLLAALSKEMALGWALTLPLWHLMFGESPKTFSGYIRSNTANGNLAVYAGLLAAGVFYLSARLMFLGTELPLRSAMVIGSGEHVAYVLKSLGKYLILALWPFTTIGPLHYYQGPAGFSDPEAVLGLALLVLVSILLIRAIRRHSDGMAVLPICFVISLLPVLNIIPLALGDNYVHERFLALPIVFLALWLSLCFMTAFRGGGRRQLRVTLAILFLGFWLVFSVLDIRVTLPFWKNDLSLWTWGYLRDPKSITGGINLINSYAVVGMYPEAKTLAEKIREAQGGRFLPEQQISYASVLGLSGNPQEGIRYMEAALSSIPEIPANRFWLHSADNNMGLLYLESGDPRASLVYFRRALALQPLDADVSYHLALALLASGDEQNGDQVLQQALTNMHPAVRDLRRAQVAASLQKIRRAMADRVSNGVVP